MSTTRFSRLKPARPSLWFGPGRRGRWTGPARLLMVGAVGAGVMLAALPAAQAAPRPDPSPVSVPGLWATSDAHNAISVTRSMLKVGGLVHSEGGIKLRRASGRLSGGTEYTKHLVKDHKTVIGIHPGAHRVAPGATAPAVPVLADYRPGGAAAVAALAQHAYTAIDPAACVGGFWNPRRTGVYTGIVYVPCGVWVTGSKPRTIDASFVAEGPIVIDSQKLAIGLPSNGFSLLSGASGGNAVVLAHGQVTVRGTLYAPGGKLTITSEIAVLRCGAQAEKVDVYLAKVKVSAPASCD